MGLAPRSISSVHVTCVESASGTRRIADFAAPILPKSRSLATDWLSVEAVINCEPEPTRSLPDQTSFAPTPSRGPSVVWCMFGSKFCQGDHLGNSTKELTV